MAFRVVAGELAPSTISVDFYFRVKRGLEEFGPLVFAKSAERLMVGNADYAPERYSIAAYIRGDALQDPIFIEMRNVLFTSEPFGQIAKGGAVGSNGQYAGGATLYGPDGELLSTRVFDVGKWTHPSGVQRDMKLRVERLGDSATHLWLYLTILWR